MHVLVREADRKHRRSTGGHGDRPVSALHEHAPTFPCLLHYLHGAGRKALIRKYLRGDLKEVEGEAPVLGRTLQAEGAANIKDEDRRATEATAKGSG